MVAMILIVALSLVLWMLPVSTIGAKSGVSPILECVKDNGDGTYTAYFGYENYDETETVIPVGDSNKITGGVLSGQDQGQPTTFEYPVPGHPDGRMGRTPWYPNAAFSVVFDGSNLVWTLDGRTATASDNPAQQCPETYTIKTSYTGGPANISPEGETTIKKHPDICFDFAAAPGADYDICDVKLNGESVPLQGANKFEWTICDVDQDYDLVIHICHEPVPEETEPTPPPEETVEVEALTEGEVEVLAFTGPNMLAYIAGFAFLMIAGLAGFALRTAKSRK